jgi:hypothetical protein
MEINWRIEMGKDQEKGEYELVECGCGKVYIIPNYFSNEKRKTLKCKECSQPLSLLPRKYQSYNISLNKKMLIVLIVCIAVLTFGFFIWPTPYYYVTVRSSWSESQNPLVIGSRSGSHEIVYRVNRFTSEATIVVLPTEKK